jgi:nitrate reductase delta subunit
MLAMRAYQRGKHVDGAEHGGAAAGRPERAEVEDMYQVMAIANYEDRFVIPSTHREYAENAFDVRGGCGFSFGNGCSDGATPPACSAARRSAPSPSRPWSEEPPMFNKPPESMRLTLRALARLLAYPDAELRAHLPALIDALQAEQTCPRPAWPSCRPWRSSSARWTRTGRGALRRNLRPRPPHLAAPVRAHHGDSRDRGPALIDLTQTYEQAGLRLDTTSCPTTWAWCWSSPPPSRPRWRAFLAEMAHVLGALFSALQAKASPYASVLAAVLEAAGEKAQAVAIAPEPELDEAWAEPEAFDGCSTRGQNRPGQPQPVHFVRKARRLFFPRSLAMSAWIDHFLFGLYPYICLAVFFIGSLGALRPRPVHLEERLLAAAAHRQLRWASNLFHIGVLFLFFGHFVGMLTPHAVYEPSSAPATSSCWPWSRAASPACWASSASRCCCTAPVGRAHPRHQQDQRHRPAVDLLGAAGAGPGHHPAVGPAPGRLGHDPSGRMGPAHRHLPRRRRRLLAGIAWSSRPTCSWA